MDMTGGQDTGNPVRIAFGAALFAVWIAETIVWLTSTVYLVQQGQTSAAVTAGLTLALLVLLAGMEGLEVAVIDRWRELFPGRTPSSLAAWLSARQLFVALIVTGATLLSHRSTLVIPFSGQHITSGAWAGVFDLTWTGLTVLWFAQILPKALAANDSARYLRVFRKPLFPLVAVVRAVGFTRPGEWAAAGVARLTKWGSSEQPLTPAALPSADQTLVEAWGALARFARSADSDDSNTR